MIIKSVTTLAFAATCLTTLATLPAAQAQPADTGGTAPGSYWTAPRAPQANYPAPPPAASAPSTQVMTNGPQTNPGDVSSSWSAQRNVAESAHYDRLLETNPGFRQARIRKECGPITDPQLRQQCLDSFAQYEPSPATNYGTSAPRGSFRSSYGR
jgi:hypothetical protein